VCGDIGMEKVCQRADAGRGRCGWRRWSSEIPRRRSFILTFRVASPLPLKFWRRRELQESLEKPVESLFSRDDLVSQLAQSWRQAPGAGVRLRRHQDSRLVSARQGAPSRLPPLLDAAPCWRYFRSSSAIYFHVCARPLFAHKIGRISVKRKEKTFSFGTNNICDGAFERFQDQKWIQKA